MNSFSLQAKIISQALPYLQKFKGKKMVIKIGGSVLMEENIDEALVKDIVLMKLVGINPIVIHGGGNHISEVMKRFKKEAKFIDGLRVTDKETLEITQMVLGGLVNQKIVSLIHRFGGRALGLSGMDGSLIIARKLAGEVDLGYVGEVVKINQSLLDHFENTDYVPVISPLGVDEGHRSTFNINADVAATKIAISLKAEKLIFVSDQKGIYKNLADESSLISELRLREIETLKQNKTISAGMLPKLASAKLALENDIASVHLVSGKVRNCLLMELFTDAGIGTKISL